MHDQYHNPTMQTQVDSSATFQIPSFKSLICTPAVAWGDREDDCLLGFSSSLMSSLFSPSFLEEASQSGGLSAQKVIIEHLCGLASQFPFVRQNTVTQTHMAGPLHGDGHARVSAPLLNYVDFLQSHNLRQSLRRQTNFRKSLCFKKLTCVPTWNATNSVVILNLEVHQMKVQVNRTTELIAKWGYANRIGFTSLDMNPEKLKSPANKSRKLKYIPRYMLLGQIPLFYL